VLLVDEAPEFCEPVWSLACPLLLVDELLVELACPLWSVLLLEGEVEDWLEAEGCEPLLPLVLLLLELPVCALRLSASKSTGAAIHTFFMLYSLMKIVAFGDQMARIGRTRGVNNCQLTIGELRDGNPHR
jgi:hypothetical protein